MSLKDLNIKLSYRTRGKENVLDQFLIPSLKCAKLYKRSVGFFSSSVFELTRAGLNNFLHGDSKISIICSPELNEKDIEAINLGYKLKHEIEMDKFNDDLEVILNELDSDDLKIMVELIAKDSLNIKVVVPSEEYGMYHDKIGYIEDDEGNQVLFVGSPNESKNAYINNYEKIRVSRSWNEGDAERIQDDLDEFDEMWDGKNEYLKQYDVSLLVGKKISSYLNGKTETEKKSELEITLRKYQEEAIKAWVNNDYKGFFVMATGTGKTWTAIYASLEISKKQPILLVICAPYKHLVKQWQEDVEKIYKNNIIVLVSSENSNWENQLKDAIFESKYGEKKTIVVISTIVSFNLPRFKNAVKKTDMEKMLIVDEAHRFNNRDEQILDEYKYLLGLSATPASRKEDLKAEQLLEFFGGKVFDLPIEYAIKKGYLVHYNYFPIFVNATMEEENNFAKLSGQLAQCFKNGICIDVEKAGKIKRNRLRVISMAEEKQSKIQWILSNIKEKDHFIVYCGDGKINNSSFDDEMRHIEFVRDELRKSSYRVGKFTATESMGERMQLIDMFNVGTIDSLVAIRCLDEGVNIPSIKGAMILSSNDDYREFVQRRGRILRTYTDMYSEQKKEIANIYDVVVLPSHDCINMAKIELRRVYEYMRLADNIDDYKKEFEELCFEYDVDVDEFDNVEDLEAELDE